MILLIDNYDSFSYNLYQLIGEFEKDIKVIRNDQMTVDEIGKLQPEKIILSPGPGKPKDAGIIEEVIENLGKEIPILGVCLGHQAICEVFGGSIVSANNLLHGKQSKVTLDNQSVLFKNIENTTYVARYHSLTLAPETLPEDLKVISLTDENEIMAVEHKEYPIYGVQFHPESVMTPEGKKMIKNFMDLKYENIIDKE